VFAFSNYLQLKNAISKRSLLRQNVIFMFRAVSISLRHHIHMSHPTYSIVRNIHINRIQSEQHYDCEIVRVCVENACLRERSPAAYDCLRCVSSVARFESFWFIFKDQAVHAWLLCLEIGGGADF
jgi:hypothetical protein